MNSTVRKMGLLVVIAAFATIASTASAKSNKANANEGTGNNVCFAKNGSGEVFEGRGQTNQMAVSRAMRTCANPSCAIVKCNGQQKRVFE